MLRFQENNWLKINDTIDKFLTKTPEWNKQRYKLLCVFKFARNQEDLNLKNTKNEILALLFGAFVILLTFGDNRLEATIGNLDTVFGLQLWPIMEIIYPAALIVIFLYYGQTKNGGKLRINFKTILPLIVFLASLTLISLDDVFQVLNVSIMFLKIYWIVITWLFPLLSCFTFFIFGKMNHSNSHTSKTQPQT